MLLIYPSEYHQIEVNKEADMLIFKALKAKAGPKPGWKRRRVITLPKWPELGSQGIHARNMETDDASLTHATASEVANALALGIQGAGEKRATGQWIKFTTQKMEICIATWNV